MTRASGHGERRAPRTARASGTGDRISWGKKWGKEPEKKKKGEGEFVPLNGSVGKQGVDPSDSNDKGGENATHGLGSRQEKKYTLGKTQKNGQREGEKRKLGGRTLRNRSSRETDGEQERSRKPPPKNKTEKE